MSPNKRDHVTHGADLLVGGFCGGRAGYNDLLIAMHHVTQRTTEFVGMTRFGLAFARRDKRYPQTLFRQALHLRNRIVQLRRLGCQTFRLYGHSMGGVVSLIAADAFGEQLGIAQVVALNPAGMYADGFVPLAKRMLAKGLQDERDARHHADPKVRAIIRARRPGNVLYLSNPVRSLAEGITLGNTPLLTQLLPSLAKTDIRVMVGYSRADTVFPPERMATALEAFPSVESFSLQGVHDAQYTPFRTVNQLHRHGAI